MKRFVKRSLSVVLMLAMLLSLFAGMLTVNAAPALPSKNTAARHTVCTALSGQAKAYYTNAYAYDTMSRLAGGTDNCLTSTSSALFQQLHTLMEDTHTYYTKYGGTSSGSLAYYWESTDANKGSSNPVLFYSDTVSGSFNREHVWPKSRASFYQSNGGSDLHHLRPADSKVNSTRSNMTMGNVRQKVTNPSTYEYNNKTVLWYDTSKDLVEINDNIKGDVARIYLYVYTRWEERNLFMNDPNPKQASGDTGGNNGLKVIESLDTLLQWCKEDPVDEWEMKRNDLTQQVQGNRNVFIDYPEYAWLLFGQEIPNDMVTPSGKAASQVTYNITVAANNPAYGTVTRSGLTITAAPKTGYQVQDAVVTPANAAAITREGNTFKLSDVTADCTVTVNFAPGTAVTLTFVVPQGVTCAGKSGYAGDNVTLSAPSGKPASNDAATFLGWADSKVADTTVKPAVKTAGAAYTLAADHTFYAVYSFYPEGVTTLHYAFDPVSCKHTETRAEHKEPTCAEAGYDRLVCSKCGAVVESAPIPAKGHTYEELVTPPTCSSKGYTTSTCTVCGYSIKGKFVDRLEHTWDEGVVTKEPTETTNGIKTFTCTVCGATKTAKIPAGTEVKPDDPATGEFTDVDSSAWYYEGVNYVVSQNLMNGVDDDEFDPEGELTRAMLVTILYRKAGKPSVEGKTNPFADVAEGQWYTDAVIWAADSGIVKGITATTFEPETSITREQIAVILYRFDGEKTCEGSLEAYSDHASVSGYAVNALVWATVEGIVNGMDGRLAPQNTATRAQLAKMLFCYLTK